MKFGQIVLKNATYIQTDLSQPLTLAQKIIFRHMVAVDGLNTHTGQPKTDKGDGVFVKADFRFIHEYYTAMAAHMIAENFGPDIALEDPQSIILFEDHLSYAHRSPTHVQLGLLPEVRKLSQAHRDFAAKYDLTDHGYLLNEEGSQGISHAMMAERYALPGALIVGTDSHTPHSGALGCFTYGVGQPIWLMRF